MKRWIAMLLTVCMLFSLCPVGAFAEPATGGTEPAQTVQTEQNTADATGAPKGTAAPAEDTPKENAEANNAENGNAAANNGTGNAENKENATGTPKENAEASNAENGNAAANNGAGNAENEENATGATNEEPKAETKTCSCKDLCDMQHPNADCEVCANSNDVGTCCKGSVAKVDAVDPQPAAGEEELVCTTCTTKCTDGHVNDSCEACKADPSKCRIVEDNQALVDTYEFYVEGVRQDAWTQSLEEGQTLNVPGNPSKDGAVFQGWYRLDGENKIPVVSGAVSGVSGKTVRVDAVFAEFSYVLFMSKDGSAVVHTAQGSSGNAVSNADLNTAAEMVNLSLGPTEAVVGWSSTQGGEAGAVAFAAGTVKVYPVIKTGYWVIFDSKGGNYVAPIFAQESQTVTLPTATRPGYTFDGWYQNGQPVTQVNAAANLEAHWTAATNTKYTVIHWQENANDENYSFKESEPKTGTTGEETKAAAKRYEGFKAQTVEQQTIAGDGSTIVNVYYKRNVYTITFYLDNPYYSCGKQEHSHSKWCKRFGCTEEEHTHSSACGYVSQITITAKHGANISDQWPTVDGSSSWRTTRNGTTYQSNIDVMPVGGGSYYGPNKDSGSETAYYYVEVLPGETGTINKGGISYKLHHSDTSPGRGYIVTEEDRYPITGFTYKEGTGLGSNYNNAKFYYIRNSYNIVFINNGATERTLPLKYEQSLSDVSYEPTRPDGVPAGYEFAGWYDNEAGEGTAFVFDGKTMPAQNITLYAKWAAPKIDATVYLTVDINGMAETLSVPYGSSLKDAPGYAELMEKVRASNDGQEPSAWFSVDGDGAKTLFNPDTKLYAPVILVPHFSGTLETFQVTYVEGDQEGPEDNNSYQSGSYATVLGPKNGNLRFLFWKDTATDKIYKPGESMKMSGDVTLIAVYTEAPATVGLTYHNGTDSRTETNIRANTFATVKSAAELGFTAPDGYVFVGWSLTENGAATYFPKNAVYVPENGAHLYAVWTERTDLSYTVRYLEKGTDNQLSGEVLVSNQTLGASVNAADHKIEITGYKFDSAEPETLEIGAEENVMVLYYVKDTSQTKPTNYTVKHIVGGEEEYSHTYTGTAWINETNPTIVIEEGSLEQKTYT
uniref:InlB B-repeat-containing protein n=1 Tax=Faecousia sp. TaxID=2952921 RepID=UPI0040274703